jgi:hypothetical protein
MTALTDVPADAARTWAAFHTSAGTRIDRSGVFGWLGTSRPDDYISHALSLPRCIYTRQDIGDKGETQICARGDDSKLHDRVATNVASRITFEAAGSAKVDDRALRLRISALPYVSGLGEAGSSETKVLPNEPGMSVTPLISAVNQPTSELVGASLKMSAPCGKGHFIYFPAALAQEGMQGRYHRFTSGGECGVAYLVRVERDGAHERSAGDPEQIAANYEWLPGEEYLSEEGAGVLL